jgi:ribokinase
MMGSAAWDVAVIGGVSTDYTGWGPELPEPGASVEGDAWREGPGGKGANQAVAAARLGARVALVGRVGDDARGEVLLERLVAEGWTLATSRRTQRRQLG